MMKVYDLGRASSESMQLLAVRLCRLSSAGTGFDGIHSFILKVGKYLLMLL